MNDLENIKGRFLELIDINANEISHKLLQLKDQFFCAPVTIIWIVDYRFQCKSESETSVPVKKPKVKQRWPRSVLGKVVTLDWSAMTPTVWRRANLVTLCHVKCSFQEQVLELRERSIPSVEKQNCDVISWNTPQWSINRPSTVKPTLNTFNHPTNQSKRW